MVRYQQTRLLLLLAGVVLLGLSATGCQRAAAVNGKTGDGAMRDSFKSAAEGKNALPPEGQKALQEYLKKNQGKPGSVK